MDLTEPGTGRHRSAEVDTGAQQVEPLATSEPKWQPLTFGTVHHPRERATLLVSALLSAGYGGRSIYQGDLAVGSKPEAGSEIVKHLVVLC